MRSLILIVLGGACTFSGGGGSADDPSDIDAGDGQASDGAPADAGDNFEAQRLATWTAMATGGDASAFNVDQIPVVVDNVVNQPSVFVLAVSSKRYAVVNQLTAAGPTWSKIGEQCSARSQSGVSMWIAAAENPPSSIVLTVDLNDTVQTAVAIVAQYSAEAGQAASMVAVDNRDGGNCIQSTNIDNDDEDYTMSLNVTPGALVLGAVSLREHDHEDSSLTEVEEIHSGESGADSGLVLLEHLGDQNSTVEMSGNFEGLGNAGDGSDLGNDWGAVVIEVN